MFHHPMNDHGFDGAVMIKVRRCYFFTPVAGLEIYKPHGTKQRFALFLPHDERIPIPKGELVDVVAVNEFQRVAVKNCRLVSVRLLGWRENPSFHFVVDVGAI